MPGLFGFSGISRQGAIASIAAMSEAMRLYPHFNQDECFLDDLVAGSRVHLGKIRMRRSPAIDEVGNRAWIDGEVYNLDEVVRGFGWQVGEMTDADLPAWLLYAYRMGRVDKFLAELDGYFCAVVYDSRRKKICLISDRHGLRMLYWYHRKGLFAWSSEVKGLLALSEVDTEVDPTSLPCFMDLGYLMGEHTWFEHIRLIKPATLLEYDIATDAVATRYYWSYREIEPTYLSFDDAVDALYEVFIQSVRRRFDPNERIGISLSGGLDSRAIFAAVNAVCPDFGGYAYTFGVPDCDDVRIAREVVSRSNWRHEQFYFSSSNWFEPRKDMIWNTDGMMDMMHMHGGEFIKRVAEHIDLNLNGYLGDVVAGGGWIRRNSIGLRANNESLSDFYRTYVSLNFHEDGYFDINRREPGLYVSRARRFTNMGTVNSLVRIEQRKPFFDNGVIGWALSMPEEFRERNRVYSAMLQRYFSRFFKDIPWQRTGKPANVISKLSQSIPVRAVRKVARSARAYAGRKDSKSYTDYPNWIRVPQIAEELSSILDRKESRYQGISVQDWRREYLTPHLNAATCDNSRQVLRAATVELYLRRVFSLSQRSVVSQR
jgi:asparagine synthase (glutamine-hydrolysing)